jgi:hypothetical protein
VGDDSVAALGRSCPRLRALDLGEKFLLQICFLRCISKHSLHRFRQGIKRGFFFLQLVVFINLAGLMLILPANVLAKHNFAVQKIQKIDFFFALLPILVK